MNEKLWGLDDLTVRLGRSKTTIYRLVEHGEIPFLKRPGLGIRFRPEDINEWLAQSRRTPPVLTPPAAYVKSGTGGVGGMRKSKARLNLGYGAVYQRKTKQGNVRWYLDYRDAGGRRIQKLAGTAQTSEQAVVALRAEVLKAFCGEFNAKEQPARVRFSEFAVRYIRDYAKVNKAVRSWKTDEYYLRAMKEFFSDSWLDAISAQDVERYKAFRLGQGVRKATVNRCLSILRKMLNLAAEWEIIPKGRIPKIRLYPEKDNLQERILNADEEQRLLRECSSALRPIVVMALATGMRLGEILYLRWADVDMKNRTIRIPKTKSGRIRIVNINAILYGVLRTLGEANGSSPYIFPSPKTGRPLTSVKTAFKAACRRASIKGLRFHDLRHTCASRLVRMGVDLITVKEILGHSSVTITERYTHTLQEQKRRAVDLLAGEEPPERGAFLLRPRDMEEPDETADLVTCSKQIN